MTDGPLDLDNPAHVAALVAWYNKILSAPLTCPTCGGTNTERWHDDGVEAVAGPQHVGRCDDCAGNEHDGFFNIGEGTTP